MQSCALQELRLRNRDYTTAEYLSTVKDCKLKRQMTRYRLSNHTLTIETDRYRENWLPKESRICPHCTHGKVETEQHSLSWTTASTSILKSLNITGSSPCSAKQAGLCSFVVSKRGINSLRRKYIVLFLVIKHGGEYMRNRVHEGVSLKSTNICLSACGNCVEHPVISPWRCEIQSDGCICGLNDSMRWRSF